MHWLRVDTYFEGRPDHPTAVHQPVPCMHCEKAPCELVCPVNATVHSSEGLNQMVYNRCVGTRYCSNNCPYKVRRFNFFQYADYDTPSLQEMYNPAVSVRERGVMEKCTYCVQRITQARIGAEVEGRRIRDGEVQTACQQACPNGAILFGDLSLRASEVARAKASPLNYDLLGELNTQPRTSYLARVRNPNPEIEGA
jgi:molybdopterin-containing oxidoreductase family iron-sulfur binding subunit